MRPQLAVALEFGRAVRAFVFDALVLPLNVPQEVVRGVVAFPATQTTEGTQFFVHQIYVTHLPVFVAEFRPAPDFEGGKLGVEFRERRAENDTHIQMQVGERES